MTKTATQLHEDMIEIDKRFSAHEAVCAERWKETIIRIKRIETILVSSCGAILMLLLALAFKVH